MRTMSLPVRRAASPLVLTVLAALLALAACDRTEQPAPVAPPASAPADTAAPTLAEPAAPAATGADEAPATGSAPVEESAGTAAAEPNTLGKDIELARPDAPRTDWKYPEGKYFTRLTAAQGTSSSPDKIEVAEVFWYGCPHCYNLEPALENWVKRLPPDVSFVRLPVIWNPTNEIHARVFYTAEALGKLDVINTAMFRGIHIENKPYTSEKDIQKLFEEHGVSEADFNRTFRSFGVDSQLQRAKDLTLKYRVQGVPLLVINGKYTTNGPDIKSQDDMLAVAEELIERERQRS